MQAYLLSYVGRTASKTYQEVGSLWVIPWDILLKVLLRFISILQKMCRLMNYDIEITNKMFYYI